MPLQRKTQCLWQNLVAKALWHLKSRYLPKAVSQSPEFSGAEFGKKNAGFKGGNRLTVQEFCFAEFLSFCTRLLIKQEFPDAKQETGVQSQNSASPNSVAFVPLQRETLFFLAKPDCKGSKSRKPANYPKNSASPNS